MYRKNLISEVIVGGVVFGLLLLILVPLPPWLMDISLATNISFAIVTLGIALYIARPLDYAVLPSVLLITTLLRLSLNIAVTRLILSQGYAGEVVNAFGQFVAGGNLVVGIIIFIIITVVQFIVVTKGAERIAEVSARFALDAMPGKQMSIDADFNAGLITSDQARQRRADLERESSFYGAMDGASKFIKGDAIAGIVITIVNITAGLTIGVTQRGLDLAQAANKYSLLTVGDALSAQVPALILSIAAGLIVTRSTSSAESLGQDIGTQIMNRPNALALASGLLFLIGFLPGLPTPAFIVLSLIVGSMAAYVFTQRAQALKATEEQAASEPKVNPSSPDMMYSLLEVDNLAIWVGRNLLDIADPARQGTLVPEIASLRHQLTLNLGYILPSVRIMDAPSLSPNEYRIVIRDTTVASSEAYPDRMLVLREYWDRIYSEPPPGALPGWDPALQEPAYWIDPDYLEQIDWQFPATPSVRVITAHLAEVTRRNIDELLTKADVKKILEQAKQRDSQIVDSLVPNLISLGDLRRVFVNLLKERVSVRDVQYILERLEDLCVGIKDPDLLSEKLRITLGRQICLEFATPEKQIYSMAFHPATERKLEESLQRVENNLVLILDPLQIQQLVTMISKASKRINERYGRKPVLICGPGLRLPLYRLLEQFDPHIHVLSYAELSPDFNVQVLETIGAEAQQTASAA
ncbi:MAG: FHIPEP family type III secretion protein [Candidatus Melainabacteria bacterium]|nr:FHIPEP family type III secretion protein [Candidatus Melainabacteria bacterium]